MTRTSAILSNVRRRLHFLHTQIMSVLRQDGFLLDLLKHVQEIELLLSYMLGSKAKSKTNICAESNERHYKMLRSDALFHW
jgi:hypothetical protein